MWKMRELRWITFTPAGQRLTAHVAAKINDAEAEEVIAGLCRSEAGCLRTILWKSDSPLLPATKFDPRFDQLGRGEEAQPLLCQEACNLLVAEMRKAVKDLPNE
jgi:hypothetical protein